MVVVDSVFFSEEGCKIVVLLSVFFCAGGFTTVVLFSVFLSAGGVIVVDFCSHAPKSATLARMQISFFISSMDVPIFKSKEDHFPALVKFDLSSSPGTYVPLVPDLNFGPRTGSKRRKLRRLPKPLCVCMLAKNFGVISCEKPAAELTREGGPMHDDISYDNENLRDERVHQ